MRVCRVYVLALLPPEAIQFLVPQTVISRVVTPDTVKCPRKPFPRKPFPRIHWCADHVFTLLCTQDIDLQITVRVI
jgi:hypothetical protein